MPNPSHQAHCRRRPSPSRLPVSAQRSLSRLRRLTVEPDRQQHPSRRATRNGRICLNHAGSASLTAITLSLLLLLQLAHRTLHPTRRPFATTARPRVTRFPPGSSVFLRYTLYHHPSQPLQTSNTASFEIKSRRLLIRRLLDSLIPSGFGKRGGNIPIPLLHGLGRKGIGVGRNASRIGPVLVTGHPYKNEHELHLGIAHPTST